MKRLKKLLRSKSGESMTELIVAFTIFMLVLATLTSMVTVGLKFNRMAADADKAYYADFEMVDATDTEGMTVSVTVDETSWGPDILLPAPTKIPYYRNVAGFIYFVFDTAPTPAPTPSADPIGGGTT